MQMTKELEKRLKIMQRFNQNKRFFYGDKIFVHNNIMYATEGHIFVVPSNLTDCKDFSFFKCNNKKFEYMDSSNKEVREIKETTKDGKNLENISLTNMASIVVLSKKFKSNFKYEGHSLYNMHRPRSRRYVYIYAAFSETFR